MYSKEGEQVRLHNFKPGQERFRAEVLSGLSKAQKELPSKYFYDEQGSQLFERICSLDEYYIPHTETEIMEACIEEIVELLGPNVLLIEYGSGSSAKTRIILDQLPGLVAYMPIDISQEQLLQATAELNSDYKGLEVIPICADYTGYFEMPALKRQADRKVVYFPGSTIGNFELIQAGYFLEHVARVCGPGGGLLIGVDLKKDPDILNRAYNDNKGVTAAFNLNLLKRINLELDSNFQLELFEHYAFYNPREGRVEMHLVSLKDHTVQLDGATINFAKGESIRTENSYKFNTDEFQQIAAAAGFKVKHVWTDRQEWFSVQYLVSI